jgi:hypothetical protein
MLAEKGSKSKEYARESGHMAPELHGARFSKILKMIFKSFKKSKQKI